MMQSQTKAPFKLLPLRPGRIAAGTLLALAFSAGSVLAAGTSARHAAASSFLSWNAGSHTASLTLIAAYNNSGSGYNYDGATAGKMTVTVPKGATVKVTFKNKSAAITHSFVITQYSKRTSTGPFPAVFKGATSPNPTTGTAKGTTVHASFVANKVGKYAIVCPVPGHAPAGMWDVFMVVKSGSAKISIK